MLLALGAVSSALDALQSLTSSKSSSPQATGFSQGSTNPFDVSGSTARSGNSAPVLGAGGFSQLSPATMGALIAAQSQSSTGSGPSAPTGPNDALKRLFSHLDGNGDGQISKSEFEDALGAGGTNLAQADDVFTKMDKNGDGSVSLDEMSSALRGGRGHHGYHHVASSDGSTGASGSNGSNSDPLLQALQGASSTSVTNSDGSTTTSVTYADGSKVTMTSPAAKTASSNATSSYNFIEQMIAREAQAISSAAPASLSVSV
jgi:EF-hand domain pair